MDLLEETRLQAMANLQRYIDSVAKTYNRKVSPRTFAPGDLVLKRNLNSTSVGKLRSKWQGPFIVDNSIRPGSYHLLELDGSPIFHTWNADVLRRFYV